VNKEKLKQEILKINDWRHPFEIEPGVGVTLHREWFADWHSWRVKVLMPTIEIIAAHVLPAGINGARVLDAGCWDGYYGFQFIRRGAKFLKGVDLRAEAVRRANLIRDYFGYENCEFERRNIQDKEFNDERYDIALLYGVLYHLSAPIDVMKRIGAVTSAMLLVNTYASKEPGPVLKLKRENPGKDSTGFQELVTTPSEAAVVDMLDFAGFDIVLREYPYPFYERFRDSAFGFFYGIKSAASAEDKIRSLLETLHARDAYDPELHKSQIVRLQPTGRCEKMFPLKKRFGMKLHKIVDKIF
jgi:SAM-dependent methyltransferase